MPEEPARLPAREAAVLAALREAPGRVLSRRELAGSAGLGALSARRVDSVVAGLRRRLPPGAVVTVRGRGWLLADPLSTVETASTERPATERAVSGVATVHRVGTSRKHAGLFPETPVT